MPLIVWILAIFLFCCITYLIRIAWPHRMEPQKMGSIPQALATICGALILIIGWSVTNQQMIDRDIANKKREILASVTEYLAIVVSLKENDPPEVYRRANQLEWQLAIWLPPDLYREVIHGVTQKEFYAYWKALLSVRRKLLGAEAGDLGPEDAVLHAPNIGKGNK